MAKIAKSRSGSRASKENRQRYDEKRAAEREAKASVIAEHMRLEEVTADSPGLPKRGSDNHDNHGNGKKGQKDGRSRNWLMVVYPDSAPAGWRDMLDELQWVESPLHDKDVDADGEIKKPHWHILLMFDGNKSVEQIKALTSRLNGTIPVVCQSARGTVRYMAHMDNPEKYQYSPSDIKAHGGVDLMRLLQPTSATRYLLIGEMREYVANNNVTEFADLFDYAATERFEDWFPLLCDSCAYIMGQYIKSVRNKLLAMMNDGR